MNLQVQDSKSLGQWTTAAHVDNEYTHHPTRCFGPLCNLLPWPPSFSSPGSLLCFHFSSSLCFSFYTLQCVRNPQIHLCYFCFRWSFIFKRSLNKKKGIFYIDSCYHFWCSSYLLLIQIFFCMKDLIFFLVQLYR